MQFRLIKFEKVTKVYNKENIRLTKKKSFHEPKSKTNHEEIEIAGELFLEVKFEEFFSLIFIFKEMNKVAGLLFQLWQKYIEILKFASFEITKLLMQNYLSKLKLR